MNTASIITQGFIDVMKSGSRPTTLDYEANPKREPSARPVCLIRCRQKIPESPCGLWGDMAEWVAVNAQILMDSVPSKLSS